MSTTTSFAGSSIANSPCPARARAGKCARAFVWVRVRACVCVRAGGDREAGRQGGRDGGREGGREAGREGETGRERETDDWSKRRCPGLCSARATQFAPLLLSTTTATIRHQTVRWPGIRPFGGLAPDHAVF